MCGALCRDTGGAVEVDGRDRACNNRTLLFCFPNIRLTLITLCVLRQYSNPDQSIYAMAVDKAADMAVLVLKSVVALIKLQGRPTNRAAAIWPHALDLDQPITVRIDPQRQSMFAILNAGRVTLWDSKAVRVSFSH